MDNETVEDIKAIRRTVAGIFCMVAILLLIQISQLPGGFKLDELLNFHFSQNENAVEVTRDSGKTAGGITYPQDKEAALALYNKYSLQHAATQRAYSYDELVGDPLKVKYLITRQALMDYAKFLAYENNKAFAVSLSGSYGYSGSNRATTDFAADEALSYCEKYMPKTDKQCFVIDINGVFLGSTQ